MKKNIFILFLAISGFLFSYENDGEVIPQDVSFFIKNIGQLSPEILYYSDITSGRIFVRERDIALQFFEKHKPDEEKQIKISNVYITFPFSNFSNVIGEEKLETKINYIKGNDPQKWYFEAPTFRKVKIKNIYEGTDLVLGGECLWHFEGNGLLNKEPIYNFNGKVLKEDEGVVLSNSFGNFFIKDFKKTKKIEEEKLFAQQMQWGTYIGGSDADYSTSIVLDSLKNVISGGDSYSTDVPVPSGYDQTHNGSADFYIAKLSSNGSSLLWATYLGGTSSDYLTSINLDSSGNIVLAGRTSSSDMPITAGSYDTTFNGSIDGYIAKLNPSGSSLLLGTYFGGTGTEFLESLKVDSSDNMIFCGYTSSTAGIAKSGSYDTSYNGGSYDMYVTKGNAVISARTYSQNAPVLNGYDHSLDGPKDFYICKLSSSGNNLLWGTYLGGSNFDDVYAMTIDSYDNIYLTGEVSSSDIPVPNGYDTTYNENIDTYIAKLLKPSPTGPGETFIMYAKKSTGTSVEINYNPLYCQTDESIYWGISSGNMTGINWINSDCLNGSTGIAYFDPSDPPAGSFYYFVIVGNNGSNEGSYGRNSISIERPQAPSGVKCIANQDISPCL